MAATARSLLRSAAVITVALGTTAATAVATATTASAAGYDAQAVACFQQTDRGPYTGHVGVEVWTGSVWWQLLRQKPNASGCVETALVGGHTYRYSAAEYHFTGSSAHQFVHPGYVHRFDATITWKCDPSRPNLPADCGSFLITM
ncbi:hypothetical protein [Modestobacter lapidis]|nr:hypothetical protein [Modestobacter lapidis]